MICWLTGSLVLLQGLLFLSIKYYRSLMCHSADELVGITNSVLSMNVRSGSAMSPSSLLPAKSPKKLLMSAPGASCTQQENATIAEGRSAQSKRICLEEGCPVLLLAPDAVMVEPQHLEPGMCPTLRALFAL